MALVSSGPASERLEVPNGVAERFYAGRERGWSYRAWAAEHLNTYPPKGKLPGGPNPDPLEENTWSWDDLLITAAREALGVEINVAAPQAARIAVAQVPPVPPRTKRYAWIRLDPDGGEPVIEVLRRENLADAEVYFWQCFEIAMCLARLAEDYRDLFDPNASPGPYVPRVDPISTQSYHQFAIAFLHLNRDCHPSWGCDCNRTRARLNMAPPERATPTDWQLRDDIMRMFAWREKIRPIRGSTPPTWTSPTIGGGGRTTAS